MAFDLVIVKSKDSFVAEPVVNEIVKLLGLAKGYVENILQEDCARLKMGLNKPQALRLKERFTSLGAIVRLVNSDEVFSVDEEERQRIEHGETIEVLRSHGLPVRMAFDKSSSDPYKGGDYNNKLITEEYEEDYIKELFRSLRSKILMGLHGVVDKSLVVTSMDVSVGKSTMSSNIAIAIANQNWKTILIDGDLRRGVLHNYFDVDQRPGVSDIVLSKEKITEEYLKSCIRETHVKDLYIMTSGKYTNDSSDILTSARFIKIKQILSKNFDMVVLDTPPIGAVVDPFVVNAFFSRYLIVVKAGKTNIVDLEKKLKEFPDVRKKVLGTVLNYSKMSRMQSYYKNSGYYEK